MTKLNGWKTGLVVILCTVAAARAQDYQLLHSFDPSDGVQPIANLAQGPDGSIYGSASGQGPYGGLTGGTIFKIAPGDKFSIVYAFCSQTYCTDGAYPIEALTLGPDNNFYGTTNGGGNDNVEGTVFKISPQGKLTTLYRFCSLPGCADGFSPYSPLTLATNGNFYGSTDLGGAHTYGTVFEISPIGSLTTLYSFCSGARCPDGSYPLGPLIQAEDGAIYGTTYSGGGDGCDREGCGGVFRIGMDGTFTQLHRFDQIDGAWPRGGVVQGLDGNFYGTTTFGGAYNGGTVFRMNSAGEVTVIYSFCAQHPCPDGAEPYALSLGSDGNFYGMTNGGGIRNRGTVFKITPSGVLTTLLLFDGMNGFGPLGGLMQATNGKFYGVTIAGGSNDACYDDCGVVFSLDTGLSPFVALVVPAGHVGSTGGILGQGFTGTTSVEINSVPANFNVVSDTYLTATVPPGATTGYVTVTTPTGVLTSNVPFRVIQ